jgi:hypothetical protein
MNCNDLPDCYSDYQENQLAFEEKQAFEQHLQHCLSCDTDYQAFLAALDFLKKNPPSLEVPLHFVQETLERSVQILLQERFFWRTVALATAALLFLTVSSWLYFKTSTTENAPPPYSPHFSKKYWDGQMWYSSESLILQEVQKKEVQTQLQQNPQFQEAMVTLTPSRPFLNPLHTENTQNVLQYHYQRTWVSSPATTTRLFSPEPLLLTDIQELEFDEEHPLALLQQLAIGDGIFICGLYFYPLYFHDTSLHSFLSLTHAVQQGVLEVQENQGQEENKEGQLLLKSHTSRNIFARAGDILSSGEKEYLILHAFVLTGQSVAPLLALPLTLPPSCAPRSASFSLKDVHFLPPSVLASVPQLKPFSSTRSSSQVAFQAFLQSLRTRFNLADEKAALFYHLHQLPALQELRKEIVESLGLTPVRPPSGWVVLQEGKVRYCEFSVSPTLTQENLETLVSALLYDLPLLPPASSLENWFAPAHHFQHKPTIAQFFQKLLEFPYEEEMLDESLSSLKFNPEDTFGSAIFSKEQLLFFQIYKDTQALKSPKDSFPYFTLWKKLIKEEDREKQQELFRAYASRLSEKDLETLFLEISSSSLLLNEQQLLLKLLLKKRASHTEDWMIQWLTQEWKNQKSPNLLYSLIDTLVLLKTAKVLPLFLEMLSSSQEETLLTYLLNAIPPLYSEATSELQKSTASELLRLLKNPSPLETSLLDTLGELSGYPEKEILFYQEFWK